MDLKLKKQKSKEVELESNLNYTLLIGDIQAKSWSYNDWIEDEENAQIEKIKGNKKQKTVDPLVHTRRFQVPFECRFVSEQVSTFLLFIISLGQTYNHGQE